MQILEHKFLIGNMNFHLLSPPQNFYESDITKQTQVMFK